MRGNKNKKTSGQSVLASSDQFVSAVKPGEDL